MSHCVYTEDIDSNVLRVIEHQSPDHALAYSLEMQHRHADGSLSVPRMNSETGYRTLEEAKVGGRKWLDKAR